MWVFVKLGVGKSQAEWENAACMNGHRLAPAYRRSTGTCVVAHSLATPGNCNCVCVLYLCISQFFLMYLLLYIVWFSREWAGS